MENLHLLSTKSKIGRLSYELYKLNKKHDKEEADYKERKKQIFSEIKQYTEHEHIDDYAINTAEGNFKFRPVVATKIIWNMEKLQEKVGKKLLNQFTDRTYVITDYESLIEYLKSCGVNPKKFAEFISVERKVNKKKLDNLSDLGEISADDISDCYRIEISSEYIKISELESLGDGEN